MTVISVPGGWVALRPINGHDESAIEAADLHGALDLLDRLLITRAGALVGQGEAGRLSYAARDRVLAAVYVKVYGEMIVSTVRCIACDKPFDLSFSLSDFVEANPSSDVRADTVHVTENGWRFRLITGDDERAVIGMPAQAARQAMLTRCTQSDTPPDERAMDEIEAAMEHIAPLLSADLSATCVECSREQQIGFDVQAFLLSRLIKDKMRLAGEVHTLAMAYHWGLSEILSLTRAERRQYIALIEADARRAAARASVGRRRIGA